MMTTDFCNNILVDKIPIAEEFYSVQGEGANTGKAAYFIRSGGCDLGCSWCDTKEAWSTQPDQQTDIAELIAHVKQTTADTIVVTGGEPLIYNFDRFCTLAHQAGLTVMLETSGAHDFSGVWDWICLSPKRRRPPQPQYFQFANEMKIVVCDNDDLAWAEQCAAKTPKSCLLFLQPEWSNIKNAAQLVVDYVKKYPKWRLSLQTHKFINIP